MDRTITYNLARVSGGENVTEVITGRRDKEIVVKEIHFEAGDDYTLRAYVDQDRIVDAAGECDSFARNPVPVNRVLKDGETLRVGWHDRAASTAEVAFTVVLTEADVPVL